jgi:hypothetical protein
MRLFFGLRDGQICTNMPENFNPPDVVLCYRLFRHGFFPEYPHEIWNNVSLESMF